ncbi:restriction endonuclease subunit S [Planococcus maritimus]|uniref:restriction endonuclease subunit S n=1 Tax=Planococcus maritimus TaxID=192421 RepID=UPI00233111C0|nr:restriction endonuclease subunit S [Planococcus maritimus]
MKNNKQPGIRLAGHVGKWNWKKLNEISTKVTEKNKDNLYSETLTNSAEFGIVSQRDFFEKDISNAKNLNGYYVVRPDDFVYNPRISNFAPVGPIKRNKLNRTGVMSPLYYVFRTKEIDKSFLERYFSSKSWHLFMKLNGDSGARSDRFAIKDVVFGEMPIPFPSIEEQKEIGDFFHKLEEIIILQQQELDTLTQTKQGFMQKMFPKEGESVPELRFPGFSEEWKAIFLKDVATFINGRAYKQPELLSSGKYKVLRVGNFYTNKNWYYSDLELDEKYYANTGDLLYTWSASFGPHIWQGEKVIYHYHIWKVEIKSGFDKQFAVQLFEYDKAKILNDKNGSTMVHITKKGMEDKRVLLPSIEEQIQIGNFFKQLDELIVLQQQELNALKQTKKAFLQKMFV